jgi:hypothetical protein
LMGFCHNVAPQFSFSGRSLQVVGRLSPAPQ